MTNRRSAFCLVRHPSHLHLSDTAMATSMAAAIAASLPAPQAASAPAAPIHDPIPASMSKLIDFEAEIALNSVQLEGLVCSTYGSSSPWLNIDVDPAGCF